MNILLTLDLPTEQFKNQKFVILDVDRTIINGTVWFRACTTPGLLIGEEEQDIFLRLNSQAYDVKSLSLDAFRKETLALIERKIKIVAGGNKPYGFTLSKSVVEDYFYNSARIATKQLKYYEECAEYIKELNMLYENDVKILFLSSGYTCFIRGVVDSFVEKYFGNLSNFLVVGSEISASNYGIEETLFMSQSMKQEVIESLIQKGANIILYADDSDENQSLFDIVKASGGETLIIDYKKDQQYSVAWRAALQELKKRKMIDFFKAEQSKIGLVEFCEDNYFIKYLRLRCNDIGIVGINVQEYQNWLDKVKQNVSKDYFSLFEETLENLFYRKKDTVYLRGKLYYYWVPGNKDRDLIFWDFIKLTQVLSLLRSAIIEANIFEGEGCSDITRAIILTILDHMKTIYLVVINMLEKAEISTGNCISENRKLNCEVQQLFKSVYQVIENKFDYHFLIMALQKIDFKLISGLFEDYFEYHQGMREEENIIAIYRSVKHILSNLNQIDFDYVVPFFYGGSELGYSIVAFIEVNKLSNRVPQLINCHYSSKNELRLGMKKSVGYYIPSTYKSCLNDIKNGNKSLLLYDNNSTTFRTLKDSKGYFEKFNNRVYSAVVAFNYNNLVNFLLDKHPYEKLVENWDSILDYRIVADYVTAFDTWGTSEKGEILQTMYNEKTVEGEKIDV